MLKKVQVIILPAKEETQSYITLLHGKLYLNDKLHGYDTIQKTQHLYFLSDEEIKEGDWYFDTTDKASIKPIYKKSQDLIEEYYGCKKIIATTDKSLQDFNFDPEEKLGNYLPQPSQSFLEVFVKEYNKGNVIREVMIEYEEDYELIHKRDEVETEWFHKLKVNSKDNTITIKSVKASWNREEYEKGLRLAFQAGNRRGYSERSRMTGAQGTNEPDEDKWIEQNL